MTIAQKLLDDWNEARERKPFPRTRPPRDVYEVAEVEERAAASLMKLISETTEDQFDAALESAQSHVPCIACEGNVKEFSEVGFASIRISDREVVRLFRLCMDCVVQAQLEDAEWGESQPPYPYLHRLVIVAPDGSDAVYRNWGWSDAARRLL